MAAALALRAVAGTRWGAQVAASAEMGPRGK